MRRVIFGLMAAGLLLGSSTGWALTSLAEVTPQNIQGGTFRLTCKAARHHTVEFVIRRDIRNISLPDRAGYLSNPAVDAKSLGTRLKAEQRGKTQTFRFSVPADRVADSLFTLWGYGVAAGEPGVTYQFRLSQFWKPNKE